MNSETEVRTDPVASDMLRAVSVALRPVHGALLDATRREYEQAHGPVKSPGTLLHLVLHDESFSWLRPLSELMTRLDTLTDEERVDANEILALHAAIES